MEQRPTGYSRVFGIAPFLVFAAVCALVSPSVTAGETEDGIIPYPGPDDPRSRYLLKSDPPTAYYGKYSDLNRIKWLTVPVDSTEPLSQELCDKISDRYIETLSAKAHAKTLEIAELSGKIAKIDATNATRTVRKALRLKNEELSKLRKEAAQYWDDLGNALIFRSRWDDAIDSYAKCIEVSGNNGQAVAKALYQIANCHLGKGDERACVKTLEDMLARNLVTGGWIDRRKVIDWNAAARQALHYFKGEDLIALNLPRWTDCKAFPEAQIADYSDQFASAPEISVSADGIDDQDARIQFFKKKLRSKSVAISAQGAYNVKVSLNPGAKVAKSEGYALKVMPDGAEIEARDRQGILWGLVSFLQVYDYEAKRVRICSIEDWPDCPRRGFHGRCAVDDCEFMLFNKMNVNTARPSFLHNADYSPINMMKSRKMGKQYKDLGLELYFGFRPFTLDLAWPICWNTFFGMQLEHAMIWASCGVGIYYPYDDERYWEPLTKEDEATGRKPSDYDADHLLKLYSAVKAKYPDFKMQFCPPFYWGPNAGHPYPDDREKYLKSLRKLPPDMFVFWTGERVGSRKKTKASRDWFAGLIGRNPSLVQNKAGPYYYQSLVLDEMPWDEWYREIPVDKDMYSVQKNSDTPQDYPILATLADYLWNVGAYDRTRAVRRGLNQYAGKGVYELLKEPYGKLQRLYAYKYGAVNSRVIFEDEKEWTESFVQLTNATAKASAIAGQRVMRGFGHWLAAVGWFGNVLKAVKNPPDYRKKYAKPYANLEEHLNKEVGCDASKGDVFVDPLYIRPGVLQPHPTSKRKHVFEHSTVCSRLYAGGGGTFTFEIKDEPEQDMIIHLRGSAKADGKFRFALNGEILHDADNPFAAAEGDWSTCRIVLPQKYLKKGVNEVRLENSFTLRIEFAVIKKADRETSAENQNQRTEEEKKS